MIDVFLDSFQIPFSYFDSFEIRQDLMVIQLESKDDESFFKKIIEQFKQKQVVTVKIFDFSFKDLVIETIYSTIYQGQINTSKCYIVLKNKRPWNKTSPPDFK